MSVLSNLDRERCRFDRRCLIIAIPCRLDLDLDLVSSLLQALLNRHIPGRLVDLEVLLV